MIVLKSDKGLSAALEARHPYLVFPLGLENTLDGFNGLIADTFWPEIRKLRARSFGSVHFREIQGNELFTLYACIIYSRLEGWSDALDHFKTSLRQESLQAIAAEDVAFVMPPEVIRNNPNLEKPLEKLAGDYFRNLSFYLYSNQGW